MSVATNELHFKIHGMDCAEEVAVLKREVGPTVGGEDRLSFDVLSSRMTVMGGSATVTPDAVSEAVARTGMRAELWTENASSPSNQAFWQRWERTILTAGSGLFTVGGLLTHVLIAGDFRQALGAEAVSGLVHVPLLARMLYGMAILGGVWQVLPKALFALKRLRPDMNLLMTVAVAGAVGIGEWFEGATVAFLFALSLALESWSVGRARRAVQALLALAPNSVRVVQESGERQVPAEQVPVGTRFVVLPGERFPLDGKVVRGTSAVNQAPITGESVPVSRGPGESVFAGTVNGEAALEVESTKPAGDTTLAHIIGLIGQAQSRRAPSEQWVEGFARVYTPCVLLFAVAVFFLPPLLAGASWAEWFYRALVLLVIACPCALVISTPVTIVAALAGAARQGVLIKGGLHVETPARLVALAMDKTGTLTEGRPAVVELIPLADHDERELLERVVALEARSEHPLGRAMVDYARIRGMDVRPAENFQILPGKGATGRVGGKSYWLGSHRYLEEREQETPELHERLEALSAAGRTVVVVGTDEHVCGLVVLADAIRAEAKQALLELRQLGIERVVLLTGDNRPTAESVGRETGVDEVRAELLPADKVKAVEELVARYGRVAMIGDGVNDAPALARATLGVAMGAAGTDAAIETADVALMSDDLLRLPWLIRHSRRALAVIHQNIAFSLGVKALFVVFTVVGYSSLWGAIAADTGASLIVIFNGLRLLRTKDERGNTNTLETERWQG